MNRLLPALLVMVFSVPVRADECDGLRLALVAKFEREFDVPGRREEERRVLGAMTPAEEAEFRALSVRFNAIAHDTPEHINDRFAMQARARVLTRTAVARAGYRLLNPLASPYDAVIAERSEDDVPAEVIEVRSLLVRADPRPHVTMWLKYQRARTNPWKVDSFGIFEDDENDYVRWRDSHDIKVEGSMRDFLLAQLPEACR
ncbi:MAG: hypothetical protein HY925_16395 [Elusimicrobia bacterium]|nr:hypothetical protein [Elusimicrobiota bacterium]